MKKLAVFVSLILLVLFIFVFSVSFASADTLEVFYAANFTAYPINVQSGENWISKIAGGPNNPISVLYGVYIIHTGVNTNLTIGSGQSIPAEFITISGEIGSWGVSSLIAGPLASFAGTTLLSNGNLVSSLGHSENFDLITLKSGGISELQGLNPASIVDISRFINLTRTFDAQGNLNGMTLNGQQTQLSSPTGTYPIPNDINATIGDYAVDMNTLRQFGDPSAYVGEGNLHSKLTSQFT